MQISGGPVRSAFPSKTSGLEDKARPPVVIEASTSFNVVNTSSVVTATTIVSPVSDAESQQQSRFIRTFYTQSEQFKLIDYEPRKLPKGVQEYMDVAQLSTQDSQRLVDEIV